MNSLETIVQQSAPLTPEQFQAKRKALGLSQRSLAKLLGVTQKTIWTWENGTDPLPIPVSLAMLWLTEQTPR